MNTQVQQTPVKVKTGGFQNYNRGGGGGERPRAIVEETDNSLGRIGSGEEFFKVFTIYWHGGHLGYVTWPINMSF